MELNPGDRVRHIPIHGDAPPSGDTGLVTRRAEDGTVGGDWWVVWDHDPERKERLTREVNLGVANMQPCDYCGKPTADESARPVCDECAGKISRHEYGTCQGDGHPLDARGMCCAPMSAAD